MTIPTNDQFFSKTEKGKPDVAFLKNHFYREGRITLISEILVPRILWRFKNRGNSKNSKNQENHSTLLHAQSKQHPHILLNLSCLIYLRSLLLTKIKLHMMTTYMSQMVPLQSHKMSTMTMLGKGALTLMGTIVTGNLYPYPPTLKKVMRCPVSFILTRSYRSSKRKFYFIRYNV